MAAQSLGSVKVFVQPENGSLEAMAIEERSSRSVSHLPAIRRRTPMHQRRGHLPRLADQARPHPGVMPPKRPRRVAGQ